MIRSNTKEKNKFDFYRIYSEKKGGRAAFFYPQAKLVFFCCILLYAIWMHQTFRLLGEKCS
jgi:hypothetical protein